MLESGTFSRCCLALLSGLGLSGCFFTEVINEKPVPGIDVLVAGPYHVGDVVDFDGKKSADDGDEGLSALWEARSCVDDRVPRCQPQRPSLEGQLDTVFSVTLESHETVEVQLRVRDSLGAERIQPDVYTIEVSNRDPFADMQASGFKEEDGAFVPYRPINLVAIAGDEALDEFDQDGDEVDFEWQLFPATGSDAGARRFESVGETGHRLVPDVSGAWGVEVTLDDGHGGVDKVRKDFSVAVDRPPCLQIMDPTTVEDAHYLVESVDGPRRFSVLSVRDALDPFPALTENDPALGEAQFLWYLQAPGSATFEPLTGYSASSYLVDPAAYNPGDRLALRVEALDRVTGPERDLPCADDDWACALDSTSQCFQRLTWGVEIR